MECTSVGGKTKSVLQNTKSVNKEWHQHYSVVIKLFKTSVYSHGVIDATLPYV